MHSSQVRADHCPNPYRAFPERAWQQHGLFNSFLILVMFPELSSVGVSRFHTTHIAFRGSRKRFSAKVPALSGSQIGAKYTWSKTFRDTCNASGKIGSRLSISNSFLHDHGSGNITSIRKDIARAVATPLAHGCLGLRRLHRISFIAFR